jgi:hypothetical protein
MNIRFGRIIFGQIFHPQLLKKAPPQNSRFF